jgi:secreted PhoX family phosphatase
MRPARRNFLLAATLASLGACVHRALEPPTAKFRRTGKPGPGYGALARMKDQDGREILALPEGFSYVTFGRTGDPSSDGFVTPQRHDGMACFATPGGLVRLIRNHEVVNPAGNPTMMVQGDPATRYDPLAGGGCMTLDFDPKGMRLVRDFVSLNGTLMNCAGGLAYRDAGWITCEESTRGPAEGYAKPHGYAFFVGRDWERARPAEPLTAMGRFVHEAAVATADGIVYETEDAGANSGFYRFLPNDITDFARGGVLQMLAVAGRGNYDTRTKQAVGSALPVDWVTIDRPDPQVPPDSCFSQGFAKGGARFTRLEGIHRGLDGSVYFISTNGGNTFLGQLWQYIPAARGGELVLRFESASVGDLESPDNLTVTPSGAILFCEDDNLPDNNDKHALAPDIVNVNRLVGLGGDGRVFEFAVNIFSRSEFAGVCFSPDGEVLFVNIQGGSAAGSGMTCAITGPWERGAL